MGESDAELVARARGGDKEAFATLVERHRAMVLALCQRMLLDASAAEDALQEAILQAFIGLDRLRQPYRFGPWLAGIGLNICRQALRAQRAPLCWHDLAGGRSVDTFIDSEPGPVEIAEVRERAAQVRQAVMALPPGQRAAVLLFYLSGLTQAEVAETLGIPVSAVKTRLHKARARLRCDLWTTWWEDEMVPETDLIDMTIRDVVRQSGEGELPQYRVLLQTLNGEQGFPIWVGQAEGTAIALLLEGIASPRPLTHALAASAITALGGEVKEVHISRLADEVFYATALLSGPNGTIELDARPSDAMALALSAQAPIRVQRAVFEAQAQSTASLNPSRTGAKEIVASFSQTTPTRQEPNEP